MPVLSTDQCSLPPSIEATKMLKNNKKYKSLFNVLKVKERKNIILLSDIKKNELSIYSNIQIFAFTELL